MAQQLAKDPAAALLCNTIATGAALVAILLMFGPVSGAHLNPAVTVVMAMTRDLTPRMAAGYIVVQIAGGIAGAVLANMMFALDPVTLATTVRAGFMAAQAVGAALGGALFTWMTPVTTPMSADR